MSSPKSHKSYRPLTVLSFKLNFALHGLDPFGFHVGNVLLHTIASGLCYELAWHVLGMGSHGALVAGLYFAGHSVHTEAVCQGF